MVGLACGHSFGGGGGVSTAAAAPARLPGCVPGGRKAATSDVGPVRHLLDAPSYPSSSLLARRRRWRAPAAAAAASAPVAGGPSLEPGDLDELLYTPGEEVPYYMGPLELREVPDAGVGVFVTEDVPCGTPLLACYPLALLRGGGRPVGPYTLQPQPQQPSPVELAHAMEGARMSPLAAAWLMGLYDGSDAVDGGDDDDNADGGGGGGGGAAAAQRARRRLGQLRQLFRQPFGPTAAAAPDEDEEEDASTAGSASTGSPAGVCCPLPPDAMARVVTFNAYGEPRPDPAVAAVRLLSDEEQAGCVGLWPPFSLINHSCAPKASYGLVGDVMVVRAATDLAAGQQVTISYFGRRALAPLELRRSFLAQHYGFICGCARCSLEEAEEAEEAGQGEGEVQGKAEDGVQASSGVAGWQRAGAQRLPYELSAFLEELHTTCSRAAAPHLTDLITGRRWAAAAAAGAGGGGSGGAVSSNEPLSELVDELSELYGYLSEGWQQLLRAAAAAAAAPEAAKRAGSKTDEGEGEEKEGKEGQEANASADAAADGEDGGDGGGGLSQEEVLWLEGSVFVLLDQLLVVLGVLGLLQTAQEQHEREQAEAAAEAAGSSKASKAAVAAKKSRAGGAGPAASAARKKAAGSAAVAAATGLRRKAAPPAGGDGPGKNSATGDGNGDGAEEAVVVVDGDGGSAAAAVTPVAEPLTAAAAMRVVTARRWRMDELPPKFLLPYVDLLAQAQEVAAAVAPGSDLAVACSVRLLYGVQAVLGSDSDDYREAEIACYDALSARYGVLEYDTYEQILEVCSALYGAAEVRLPGFAGATAAPPPPPSGPTAEGLALPGGPYVDGAGEEGGMVGLRLPAVPVEVEVVE